MTQSIHVLGAGIVGICCAIELTRRGFDVTLVDQSPPVSETSYGNAGVIAAGSIFPEASPDILKRIPGLAINRSADFRLDYRQLPRMLPYLVRFVRNTRNDVYTRHAGALNALLSRAVETHTALIDSCGAGRLLRRRGWLKLYRTRAALVAAQAQEHLLEEHGVEFTRLDSAAIADLEPHLERVFVGGRWITGAATISNPGALGNAYADLFRSLGGKLVQTRVRALSRHDHRWRIQCENTHVDTEHVVVALGAWSRDLLLPLGYHLPLVAERGYHRHFNPDGDVSLNRPIHDIEAGYVLAPMAMGHRLTTGVEWAPLGARPTPVQLALVEPRAREAFPLGTATGDIWLGNRPQTPDSLPVIGGIPRHRNLWLATGHGHLGLSLGPLTGILLARTITGEATDIDMNPYAPSRFV
jgi:D-amino-acid dehydrogenase